MQKVTLISQKTDDQLSLLHKKLGTSKVALIEQALDLFAQRQFNPETQPPIHAKHTTFAAFKDTSKALLHEIKKQLMWDEAFHSGVDE